MAPNDQLLPPAGYRQWVLSVPWTLRYMMARQPKLLSMVLSIFVKAIFINQRRRAKALGIIGAKTGSVTFVQRFGAALNLNVHYLRDLRDRCYRRSWRDGLSLRPDCLSTGQPE